MVGISTGREVEISLERQNDGSIINKAYTLQENSIDVPAGTEPFYDYSIDKASGVAIFTLRQCVYDKTYKTALKDFFTSVRDGGVHSVIVDLRGNPGGNSLVASEFIRYLPVESYKVGSTNVRFGPVIWKNQSRQLKNQQADHVFSGDVYVLTGPDNFSAAMDFATLLSDNGCMVVGEIPEICPLPMEISCIFRRHNTACALPFLKYFIRPDATKSVCRLLPDLRFPLADAMEETLRLRFTRNKNKCKGETQMDP